MSLQIWMPLMGNLNNQGLEINYTVSGSPAYSSNGKIGKCLSTTNTIEINAPVMVNLKSWSVCFWGYITSSLVTSNWTGAV